MVKLFIKIYIIKLLKFHKIKNIFNFRNLNIIIKDIFNKIFIIVYVSLVYKHINKTYYLL